VIVMPDQYDYLKAEQKRKTTLQNLKGAISSAKADLNTIQTTTNPTNTQIIWAVKREAQILAGIINYLENVE